MRDNPPPIYAIVHGAVSCKGYFALALVTSLRNREERVGNGRAALSNEGSSQYIHGDRELRQSLSLVLQLTARRRHRQHVFVTPRSDDQSANSRSHSTNQSISQSYNQSCRNNRATCRSKTGITLWVESMAVCGGY